MMKVSVFFLFIVSITIFASSFESGAAFKMIERDLEDAFILKMGMEHLLCENGQTLDPCLVGNFWNEVLNLMRRCFNNCPLMLGECSKITSNGDQYFEIEYNMLKKRNMSHFLESDFINKDPYGNYGHWFECLQSIMPKIHSPTIIYNGSSTQWNETLPILHLASVYNKVYSRIMHSTTPVKLAEANVTETTVVSTNKPTKQSLMQEQL